MCPYPEGRDFCSDGCAQCGTRSSTQNQQALDLCRIAPLFTNSVGAIQVQAIKKISPAYLYTNTTNQYRVQGTFLFGGTDIRDWPFETESLNITLEDPNRGLRELSFRPLPEYSGVSPHALSPGWDVKRRQAPCVDVPLNGGGGGGDSGGGGGGGGSSDSGGAVPGALCDVSYRVDTAVAHPGRSGNFSQLSFRVEVSRPRAAIFLKDVLPFFLILLPQYYSFSMPVPQTSTRASIAASGLVSSILLHISVGATAPVVGQLLFIDRFLLAVYSVIILNLVGAIVIMKGDASRGRALRPCTALPLLPAMGVRDLHHWCELLGWCVTPAFFLFPFFSLAGWPAGLAAFLLVAALALAVSAGLRRQRNNWHSLLCHQAPLGMAQLDEEEGGGVHSGEEELLQGDGERRGGGGGGGAGGRGLQMALVSDDRSASITGGASGGSAGANGASGGGTAVAAASATKRGVLPVGGPQGSAISGSSYVEHGTA